MRIGACVLLVLGVGCDDGAGAADPARDRGADGDASGDVGAVGDAGRDAGADAAPETTGLDYSDPALWLCRPDLPTDICREELDAVVVAEDGALTADPHVPAVDPPFDCFYVYPTVSLDAGANSDLEAGVEEPFVTRMQAGRYARVCRVFAPLYRQLTIAQLFSTGFDPEAAALAYADVQGAFRAYLDDHADGRPFLLIGHSQGTSHLRRLVAEQIDGDEALRGRLVGAHLLGNSIQVPVGADVGGDFAHVPLCRDPDQAGCVVTYATYRATDPPDDVALFGGASDPGLRAGCTHPAALMGGPAPLAAYFPTETPAELAAFTNTVGPFVDDRALPEAPFYGVPGLVQGECVERDGRSWLEITLTPGDGPRADAIGGDLMAGWGLHLVDVNLGLGDLVELAERQGAAWARR